MLLLHLFLLLEFGQMFFCSSFFFIKGLTQVRELYSNHEIQHEKGTEKHTEDKEWIVPIGLLRVSDNVHHIGPPFKCYDLKDVQNTHENIIKVKSIRYRILVE